MVKIKVEFLQDFLTDKKKAFKVKTTTYLKGSVKNRFFDDCIKREICESQMAAEIIESYYSIIAEEPTIHDKEITQITDYIKSKIRL